MKLGDIKAPQEEKTGKNRLGDIKPSGSLWDLAKAATGNGTTVNSSGFSHSGGKFEDYTQDDVYQNVYAARQARDAAQYGAQPEYTLHGWKLPNRQTAENQASAWETGIKPVQTLVERNGTKADYLTDTGFDDPLYAAINGSEDARSALYLQAGNRYRDFLVGSSHANTELTEMTPDEVDMFNYIYATNGRDAAHNYYDRISGDLNFRQRAAEENRMREFAKESPVGASAFSVLTSPLKSLSYMEQAADYLSDGGLDANAPYNRFSYGNTAIRSQVSDTIEKSGKWGKVGSFAYNTGMSMGDFLLNTAITGGNEALSLTLMGMNAAADTVLAKKAQGYSDDRAFILGTLAGAVEAATEKIGFDALFKSGLVGLGKEGLRQYLVRNMAAEGAEEGLADILNWGVDALYDVISGENDSEWKRRMRELQSQGMSRNEALGVVVAEHAEELGLDVAGGMLSGGVMAGVGGAGMAINYNRTGSAVNNTFGTDAVQDLVNLGLKNDQSTQSYQYANEIQTRLARGEQVSNLEVGQLFSALQADNAENETGIISRETTPGPVDEAYQIAMGRANALSNYNTALEQNGAFSPAEIQARQGVYDAMVTPAAQITREQVRAIASDPAQLQALGIDTRGKDGAQIRAEVRAALEAQEQSRVNEETRRVDNMLPAQDTPITLYDLGQQAEGTYGGQGYTGEDRLWQLAQEAARRETEQQAPQETPQQMQGRFATLRAAAEEVARTQVAQQAQRQAERQTQQQSVRSNEPGLVRDEVAKKANLTNREARAIDALGRVIGKKIRFAESLTAELRGEDGNIQRSGANAQIEGDTITISLQSEDPFLVAAVHEVVHGIRDVDEEAYQALANFVTNNMSDRASFFANMEQAGMGYSREQIPEETVATAFGRMLGDEKTLRQFVSENTTAAERFMDALRDLLDKIRQILTGSKREANTLTENQRAVYKDLEGRLDKMLLYFTDALNAVKDSENAEGSGETRYALSANAADEIHRAAIDKNYTGDIRLTDTSPSVMVGQRGVKNLPMLMKADQVRKNILTEAQARALGIIVDPDHDHYHGLTEPVFKAVIDHLDDVSLAYRGTRYANDPSRRENYFLLLPNIPDANGNQIIVPVYINEHGRYNRVTIDTNRIATVFSPGDVIDYVQQNVANKNLVRIKKRGPASSEAPAHTTGGYADVTSAEEAANQAAMASYEDNVSQTGKESKKNFPDADYLAAVELGMMDEAQEMVNDRAKESRLFKRNAGEETAIYIPDGTANGRTVSFTDLIFDGKKKGETRGLNTHFPVNQWLGVAKNGKVVGRVKFGPAIEITTASPEYADAMIRGTQYDIKPGEKKLYYPIIDKMDLRTDPRPVVRNGNYGVYQFKSSDTVTYDDDGNVIPVSKRFDTRNPDKRYSLMPVKPVKPSGSAWQRGATYDEVKAAHPTLYELNADENESRNPTQVTVTQKSYRKIYKALQEEGFDGTILDASSGLGLGTQVGRDEFGYDVEDIEPFPDKSYKPMYTDYSTLNNTYDVIISNAVLNVLPQDLRDDLTVKMGEMLNPGGRLFVNVRGSDVKNAKSKVPINEGQMEYFIEDGASYQKGFTKNELKAYLEDALGTGYTVEPTNQFGAVSAVVTKDGAAKSLPSSEKRAKAAKPADLNPNFARVRYSLAPPYRPNTAGYDAFVETLSKDARSTYNMFSGVHDYGMQNRVTIDGSAKDITQIYMTASKWNAQCGSNAEFAKTAKALAEMLPADVRKAARIGEDGRISETPFEKEFKMERAFIQRLIDSLPNEVAPSTYKTGGKTVRVAKGDKIESVGGEGYRRALVEERRALYRAGKLPTKSIGGMSKDTWGAMGFLATNGKTGASGDFTTLCPQMYFNKGCFYCYRRAALTTGVNNKLMGENVWYTGEILHLTKEDIDRLNRNGGLRIQSFGDWMSKYSTQLADLLIDAETVGLQIKIITKEPSMIDTVALLREQGLGKNLYFNLSADYTIEKQGTINNQDTEGALPRNPQRPYQKIGNDTYWKRALTVEEANEYRKKYPWVNTRIVATTVNEFLEGLRSPMVDVVTGYHGNIRQFERVSSATGETLLEVEPLGDAGMPRFAFDSKAGKWVLEYEGKTATHKTLAKAIEDAGLQFQYYIKSCCITGRCATCEGKCGKLAKDFNVKNATNADKQSVAYWQKHMTSAEDNPLLLDQMEDEQAKALLESEVRYSRSGRDVLDELIEQYGPIDAGENPVRDVPIPKRTTDKTKVSMTIRTVAEAGATPEEYVPTIENLVANHKFDYTPYSDKKAIANANSYVSRKGYQSALAEWEKTVGRGEVSKTNTAVGWALYNNAVNSGDTENALQILRDIVAHQRNAAQAVQATRILKQLNPETQLYNAEKTVEQLNDDLRKKYGDKAPELEIDRDLAERFLRARSDEGRAKAMSDIYKDIGRQMPTRFLDRWNAWRYLAMLGNPRTHIRNVVGNAGFAPIVATKDLVATGIEAAVDFVSGGKLNRTKGVAGTDLMKAAWNDYANIREQALGEGKYSDAQLAQKEINDARRFFGNTKAKWWNKSGGAVLERARKLNGDLLNKEDEWFSKPHYTLALAQYCAANHISAAQIRSGKGIETARQYAIREARKATYRDTNTFSEAVSRLGRGAQWQNNKTTKLISMAVEGILPFRKTPANILVRGVEYSPLGLLKSITYDLAQLKKDNMSGADWIDHFSAGLTGTGLLALGALLASQGLLRGRGGDDEKKKKFDDLTGHQDYAIEFRDGTSITLDWLAPEALPLFMGANLVETARERNGNMKLADILSAIGNVTEPMLEMSCLQSLNAVFDTVGYAKEGDVNALTKALASAATSYLTQALPTIGGQAERTGEDKRMTTYTDKNKWLTGDMQYTLGKASAKIPFGDYQQIPYIDAWGREETTGGFAARLGNNFFNPAFLSKVNESDMEKELERLYKQTGETVFPERPPKYFTVDGERKDLTADEYVTYATNKGRTAYTVVGGMVSSEMYKNLSDNEKAAVVKDALAYANQTAQTTVGGKITKSWIDEAKGGVSRGIKPETYILINNAVKEAEGFKDSKGETIDNSPSLQKMSIIYNVPGLNDDQRKYLFECFDIGSSIIGWNKTKVDETLKDMKAGITSDKAKGAVDLGIKVETYDKLHDAAYDVAGIKDANGKTISNSVGLQRMELIYNTPGLTDQQRKYLFECFGVGSSIIDLNKAAVQEKLAKMR